MAGELEVLIIDDQLAVRRGIELLLRSEGMRVVGVAERPAQARRLMRSRRYDVVLADALEDGGGIAVVSERLEAKPATAVVLFTSASNPEILRKAVAAGVRGALHKSADPHELVAALRTVAAGGTYVDGVIAGHLAPADSVPELELLSPRELQILHLLADGLSGARIADHLGISSETVRTHVRNAMRKLGARTRVQAVAIAVRGRGPG